MNWARTRERFTGLRKSGYAMGALVGVLIAVAAFGAIWLFNSWGGNQTVDAAQVPAPMAARLEQVDGTVGIARADAADDAEWGRGRYQYSSHGWTTNLHGRCLTGISGSYGEQLRQVEFGVQLSMSSILQTTGRRWLCEAARLSSMLEL